MSNYIDFTYDKASDPSEIIVWEQNYETREIEEKRYGYFIEQVENILGDSIDNLIAEFDDIARDNEIEISLIDYLKDR